MQLKTNMTPAWSDIRSIRNGIAQLLADVPEEVRNAAVMTASELLENAIKYGKSVPNAPGIQVSISLEHGKICLSVSHGVPDLAAVRELQRHLCQLSASTDRAAPYMNRLRVLLEHPSESAKLGLYRISFEGGFDLQCSHDEDIVSVVATRSVE